MYDNRILQLQAVESFGRACGLIVASGVLDIPHLLEAMNDSDCVRELVVGNVLFCTSSPLALAQCIAQETGKGEERNNIAVSYSENKYDVMAEWLGKTELDVAVKLGKSIRQLRETVSAAELQESYGLYHIYMDTDIIIANKYKGGVLHEA